MRFVPRSTVISASVSPATASSAAPPSRPNGWSPTAIPVPRRRLRRTICAGDVVAFHRDYKSSRRLEGRRAARRRGRSPQGHGDAGRPRWTIRPLAAARRWARSAARSRYTGRRIDGAARRRPHPLDPQPTPGLGLVNSDTAEVASVRGNRVAFRLGDGRTLELGKKRSAAAPSRPCLGLDRACVSGAHRRQRDRGDGSEAPETVDPEELLRRDQPRPAQCRLVTDDAKELRETLEAATGERSPRSKGSARRRRRSPKRKRAARRKRAAERRNAGADWRGCWSGPPEPRTRRRTRAASSGRERLNREPEIGGDGFRDVV